jgi:radical SAM protein with 4Fe4S-binding SPASM domain
METPTSSIRQRLPSFLAPRLPTTYTFELTADCNHSCVGCGNVFSHQARHLSLEKFKTLITRLPQPPASLRLTGGEVTLHPEFSDLIEWVDQLAIPYVIFTNGYWENTQAILDLLRCCQHLSGLLISLHGDTASSHRAFTGEDSFNQVCSNIKQAVQIGLRIGTNTLLLQTTRTRIYEIIEMGKDLGVHSVHFSRYYGPPLPRFELSAQELGETVRTINKIHSEKPKVLFNNCIPACFIDSQAAVRGCTSGFTHATIDPEGIVRPCTHTPIPLGNLFEQEMDVIWDSKELWAWRGRVPEGCFTCVQFTACRGGCRATAYQNGMSQDPLISFNSPMRSTMTLNPIELNPRARPVINFTIHYNGSEIYLINLNEQFPIKENALSILSALDGKITLLEINDKYGKSALDFIGILVTRGLVLLVGN